MRENSKKIDMTTQPKQKPVAWGMPSADEGHIFDIITPEEHDRLQGDYTIPLYTTPPQRKPLTDEQKMALCKQFPDHLTFNAIHAIEAKLREKNGL